MKKCVIVSACAVSEQMRKYTQGADLILACDAGYRNLKTLGVHADLIIGDFDSAEKPGDENDTIVLPHVKDDTDTLYAIRYAIANGANEIVLLGGLGGTRLSHSIANLYSALFAAKQGVKILIADENTEIYILLPGEPLHIPKNKFAYFSLFPLEGQVTGLNVNGAFYNVNDGTLDPIFPIGVSNEITGEFATLSIRSGAAAVILDS